MFQLEAWDIVMFDRIIATKNTVNYKLTNWNVVPNNCYVFVPVFPTLFMKKSWRSVLERFIGVTGKWQSKKANKRNNSYFLTHTMCHFM